MDRQIIYPGQIPLETDLLNTNKNAMIGLSKLAAAILGTGTFLNGLACAPTGPASLQVNIAPGEIYSLQNIDGTAYSSIAADTTHTILKQGVMLDQLALSCPAPATAGQSINYLVQVTYQDLDANAVTLPYYNASNPSQAYSGPNNSGTPQNTVRKGVCTVAAKAGVAATTGSQTTPAPDSGYVGAFVVTVANGQTQILAGNISTYAGAPFMPTGGVIVGGLQNNLCNSSVAGGTADALTGSYFPGIAALPAAGAGVLTLYLRPSSANATSTPTFTPNSGVIAAKQIVKGNGLALIPGDIAGAGHWVELQYDATLDKWVLLNPATGIAASVQTYTLATIPTTNVGAMINVVGGDGQWEWVSTAYFTGYRHPRCGLRVSDAMLNSPPSWAVDAVGGNMSKTSVLGSRIWSVMQENSRVVALGSWAAGNHHVADNGDGTFKLPDLRRTYEGATAGTTDPDTANVVAGGAYKNWTIGSHSHSLPFGNSGNTAASPGQTSPVNGSPSSTGSFGASETAPRTTAAYPRIHG